jgi:hypothetical protein
LKDKQTIRKEAENDVDPRVDLADSLTLDLWMAYPSNLSGIFPVDPIDSLQTLYDAWKISVSVPEIRTGTPSK